MINPDAGYIGLYRGYLRIMENKMETTIVKWGYIGRMENKMEATIGVCFHGTALLSGELQTPKSHEACQP